MTVSAAPDHVAYCTWHSAGGPAQGTFDQQDLELADNDDLDLLDSNVPGKNLLFREWQAANRKAHLLEQELARACLDSLERNAGWPSDESRAEAQKVRALADDLFKVAMAQIDDRARSTRHT